LRILLVTLALLYPAVAVAQRAPFAIPDPDPEVERRSFLVADGFEVNLFAADPVLAKPIQMNFDPAGRLWVACSEVYPQIQPGQAADDKILVLEDADGDGRADKTTVFADGLLIPTGVEPGDGGAYVANSTELLHLSDTDGDGKADRRRTVLDGFGTEDTHHILHTLRWGFEGSLHFNQSIYIHSNVETPRGVRRLGGGGVWSFRPESMELGVFVRGLVNPWGFHHDRWGQAFVTDGAGGEGINYALPGAYFVSAPDAVRVLPGLNPGSPKDCGLEVLSGRHLPDDWQGNLLTNDFRGNRVCRYVLSDDGAGFSSRELPELIRTPHVAFRPIDVKLGPDGAIYIADWYNPIIQHGEVDFRDPRRDHTRGRIWRVTAKGRALSPRPKLVGAGVGELLDALKAPEGWTRHQAKRVLKERGAEAVLPALAAWVRTLDDSDPGAEHHRLEALWTYQGLDVVEPGLLARLLKSGDFHVRAAALRVTGEWQGRLSDPRSLLAPAVADDLPRVRLEAVRALAKVPGIESAGVALGVLDRPLDPFLDYALWLTARETQSWWLPEVNAGRSALGNNPLHQVFALQAVGSTDVVAPLLRALKAGAFEDSDFWVDAALKMAARLGAAGDLTPLFETALEGDGETHVFRRAAILDGLSDAAVQRRAIPEGDLNRVGGLFGAPNSRLRSAAIRAAGAWKLKALAGAIREAARPGDAPFNVRYTAAHALERIGGPEGRDALTVLSKGDRPSLALAALATLDAPAAARIAADRLVAPAADPAAGAEILSHLAGVRGAPDALAAALAGRAIPTDLAKLAVRGLNAASPMIGVVRRAGGLGDSPKALTPAEAAAILADVQTKGNPARGETVFRLKSSQCLDCHAIAGAGGRVGPGLESIGASAPLDYLLDSLVDPNKAVKEGYHSLTVATADGRVTNGLKVRQTVDELVLLGADGREHALALAEVEDQRPGLSLMPAGLTELWTHDELVDVVRFLSELGKLGPYAVGQARVVRRWEVLESNPSAVRALAHRTVPDACDDPTPPADEVLLWRPAYSTVAGLLPYDDLPVVPMDHSVAVARTRIEVSVPGPVRLALESASQASLFVDGRTVDFNGPVADVDLAAGTHTLLVADHLGVGDRSGGIRCTLEDVPGSPARARVVVGP